MKHEPTIMLEQARSGRWRASSEQSNMQTAVFGETAEDAASRLMRFRRG